MNLSIEKIKWIKENFFFDEFGRFGPNGTLYFQGRRIVKPVEIIEAGESWKVQW